MNWVRLLEKQIRSWCWLVLGCLVVAAGMELGWSVEPATAGGLLNIEDSWLVSSSLTHRLLAGTDPSFGRSGEILGTVGQGRLFAMSELDQRSVALEGVVYRWGKKFSWAGSWQRTGKDLFLEDRSSARILLGQRPALGVAGRRIKQILAQRAEDATQEVFLVLQVPLKWRTVHGVVQVQWPGYSSPHHSGNPAHGRRTEALKATIVHSDHAIALVIDRLANGRPNFGFQMIMALATGVGLEFRVDSPTGSLGPGLSITRGGLMLRTSHVVHPKLGVTHRFALVFGRFGGERP